jgi:AmmeMemoRadiSam system protein A
MNTQDNSQKTGKLSPELGASLLRLARQTIAGAFQTSNILSGGATTAPPVDPRLDDPALQEKRGTFVTLKINKQLRGCMGSLTATESIRNSIQRNAATAAFRDPRFPGLTQAELGQVHIEVSILTDPQPLEFTDSDDLLNKLRPNIDGVIIRRDSASATFLPQVWQQLPRKEIFLEHLCRKAGLPGDSWKQPGLKVFTYQVQYFEE